MQRRQRAKAPPRTGLKHPQKAPKTNYFRELGKTPEGRALRAKWAKERNKSTGRPVGVPDGYRKQMIEPIREREKQNAKEIVSVMADKFGIEDNYATEALEAAVEILRVPGETRERLAAARLVLDFTKQKPASKNELSVSRAEQFLEALIIDDKESIERKRLREDFAFYSKASLKIRTKQGEVAPLDLNPAQQILNKAVTEQLQTEGKIRIIILKARQQGLSTYVGGYLYFSVSQRKAQKAMVVTHHADSTRALFDMTRRYHTHCPDILKPSTKYSSRRELSFDVLDSSYVVATAGGDSVGRGETLTHVHASELAFWPKSTQQDIWNGLAQAVPNTKDTAVYIESTANGVSGVFYDLWKGAVEGTNGYVPVFIPWYTDPEYREPVPDNFEITPDEEELVDKYDLDDEQLMFRRRKIAQNGYDLFRQEYPSYPEEAFLTTGRPVFNPDQLQETLEEARDVKERLALEGGEWRNHSRGELTTYITHDPGEQYVIGADVAMGVKNGDLAWSSPPRLLRGSAV